MSPVITFPHVSAIEELWVTQKLRNRFNQNRPVKGEGTGQRVQAHIVQVILN